MSEYTEILDLFIENFKKIFYPEEWFAFDMSVSKTELFSMLLVDRHGEIIMSQIADYINLPMSTATGLIERMVKNGYMERARSDADRRIVVVRLTPKGKEFIEKFKQTVTEYIKLIYEAVTEEERHMLFNVFTRIIGILNQKNIQKKEQDTPKPELKKISIE